MAYLFRAYGSDWFLPQTITADYLQEAARRLKDEPVDSDVIRRALLELWYSTKHEKMSEQDRNAMILLYAQRLSAHPPKHVALVLNDMSETSTFFPSWSEISARLGNISGERHALINALRRFLIKMETTDV